MIKAISLLSGGLDSILAAKLILDQGIEVKAINFSTVFTGKDGKSYCIVKNQSEKLGIKFNLIKLGEEYLSLVKNPKYGYGANFNPCIDCHIFMLQKAAEYMKKIDASFLITGEVLGQRPMSQKKDTLRLIGRELGLKGLIIRPLSAKLLEKTIPEKKKWVDREKLLDIQGRSRKKQIWLAKKFGIDDYLTPSGGCLLTDPEFSKKLKDLKKFKPEFMLYDVKLLKTGRHFRLTPETKLIVGRDEKENHNLQRLTKKDDIFFYPINVNGPVGIGRGKFSKDLISLASSIIARYSDSKYEQRIEIICKKISKKSTESIRVLPLEEEKVKNFRI